MSDKILEDLLEIKDSLIKDNSIIDYRLGYLYLKRNRLNNIINKIENIYMNNKISNDKADAVIITALISLLAISYEIITIGTDNGITRNNFPIVSLTPIISSTLSYLSFIPLRKDISFIDNNPLDKVKKEIESVDKNINSLIRRKYTNNKILDRIDLSLSQNDKKKKTLVNHN